MELVNSIQVTEKSYKQADGTVITAHMLRMGDQDYLTVMDAAEAFGVTVSNIRHALKNHHLDCVNVIHEDLKRLKSLGVVMINAASANLLPRNTLDQLVRIINTPEAKAAYTQIVGEWREAAQGVATTTSALMHMADGIKSAVRAASSAAELALEVNTRVDQIAAIVALNKSQADQEYQDSALSSVQQSILFAAIHKRAKELGDIKEAGKMMAAIKRRFLPTSGGRTWKEIQRRHYDEAMELVTTWTSLTVRPRRR